MTSWWPKSSGKDDDKPASALAVTQSQSLSVVASGSSQPGSAPPSLPQSPSARRGVNLLDEVVSALVSVQRDNLLGKPGAGVSAVGRTKKLAESLCTLLRTRKQGWGREQKPLIRS